MNLTEGQLFTIEALNRIDGFVWPEGAKFASMDAHRNGVDFYHSHPQPVDGEKGFGLQFWLQGFSGKFISEKINPDWRNSLITREEFESVDGWVRNDGDAAPMINYDALIDVSYLASVGLVGVKPESVKCDFSIDSWTNVLAWRYHKPTKENEMKDTEVFQPPIHETYYRYKKQRETTTDARKALEASMEAEDKLLEQIKAWNLEYGFDIRVLDESDEVPEPELVITDWRDLRVGDEIECIKPCGGRINRGDIGVITQMDKYNVIADFENQRNYLYEGGGFGVRWKFIRRPSK